MLQLAEYAVECIYYLTERVKSPGLLLLGRAKKLPSTLLFKSSSSASIPDTLGWNHLQEFITLKRW